MDRRQAIQAGVLSSGVPLLGGRVSADLTAETGLQAAEPKLFDSHAILGTGIIEGSQGSLDLGRVGPGLHAREFAVPEGTHLVMGQVQEGTHFGHAKYHTLGVAIAKSVWRCRVIWRMEWYVNNPLETYFHWVRY